MSVQILTGDCREVLRTLPDESVHCVVTSPPYWGLRDYGACPCGSGRFEVGQGNGTGGNLNYRAAQKFKEHCSKCNGTGRIIAMDTQLGLERSLGEHIEVMVEVFREVRRVLRKDGSLWLNYGDSYAGGGRGGGSEDCKQRTNVGSLVDPSPIPIGLKPKDLCGVPWRVAFALQADGWWLRSDIIWSKPNPMPESVTDRPTKAHEYLFLLTKSANYFYDSEAIREPQIEPDRIQVHARTRGPSLENGKSWRSDGDERGYNPAGRNKRTVWEVATAPFSEAHFATFPPALIEPCIKAGTSEKGCCAKCGKPWVREVGKSEIDDSRPLARRNIIEPNVTKTGQGTNARGSNTWGHYLKSKPTLGWSLSCSCSTTIQLCSGESDSVTYPVVPCTVLDPFGGAGTTGLVADRLQRNAILIELNPEYAAMARRRIDGDAPLFSSVNPPSDLLEAAE